MGEQIDSYSIKQENISFQDIRQQWLSRNFRVLKEEELLELFNGKYGNGKEFHGMTLLDEDGTPVMNNKDERVLVNNLNEITDFDKKRHIRGYLKMFDDNQTDYVQKLSEEKELLEILAKKGSKLKQMMESYLKDESK